MKLVPIRPPGPNARRARAYADEIAQLRTQGYTFEAIREALAGAGVHVSNSTVQREAIRATKLPALAAPAVDCSPGKRLPTPVAPVRPAALHGLCPSAGGLSGKEIAEAFVSSQTTNTLIRAKEQR